MEEEASVSALPWTWVIEALAKSELVDSTLLYELVSQVPQLLGDLGEQSREAVALRCLEGFFGPPDVSTENHVASEQSKFRCDPTESCEAALQWILNETSGSKDALDELKWDVQSFVKHKKANMTRSTLELLDDLILEGTHPLAASLKEMSGLAVQDQCVLNIPFDGGDPTSPPLRSDEDDYVDKTILAEKDGCFPRACIDEQSVGACFPIGDALPFRGGISSRHTDNHEQEIDVASSDMDNQCPPGKKCKSQKDHNMQAMQQHSVPVRNQMYNGLKDGQCHEIIKPDGIPDGKICGKDDDEPDKEYVENHDKQHISPNNGDNCQEEIDLALKNGIHDWKTYGKDVDEPDKEYVENLDEQEISPNNGDNCPGEIDLTLKILNLSSRFASTEDPPAMTETQPNLCMKCNKDGQLLSCSARSCPLLFHEGCLGCSPHFDDEGNFICPMCAYFCAKSEYDKAKQKVSVARKQFSLFIGGRIDDQPEHDGDTTSGDDVNEDKREIGDKTAEAKKGANYRHKDGDRTAEVKKGDNVVQAVEPHPRSLKGKQVVFSHSPAHMDVSGFTMATGQQISFKGGQDAEIIIKLPRDPFQIGNHGQYDGAKLSGDNERQIYKETSRCKITELNEEASSESISDSDEPIQEKRNKPTGSLASPTPIRAIPMTPQGSGRRKNAPWTAQEESMLKKGVEMFVQQDRTIPWKAILEYGGCVFKKGRTAMNLKDKWKNMKRGTSPKV